eukprot:NODE_1287_length_1491_cov_3.866158_g1070_i0.p2 GENE.NODE_1287_length_1491_cov_3.866158_g1070_i0~~NODE_1287_length_1491_cov_3.866158_g1070_i0.p2  ORF type:complete len:197 (+),score=16.31 NODE_1287_length_1491_cov_3.866158_g1070_i0:509-1099(+)
MWQIRASHGQSVRTLPPTALFPSLPFLAPKRAGDFVQIEEGVGVPQTAYPPVCSELFQYALELHLTPQFAMKVAAGKTSKDDVKREVCGMLSLCMERPNLIQEVLTKHGETFYHTVLQHLASRYPQCQPQKLLEGLIWLYHLDLDDMLNNMDAMTKAGTVFADWLKPVEMISRPPETAPPVTPRIEDLEALQLPEM